MKRLISHWLFRYFASIKFAIPIMTAWMVAMILGTIAESRFGTEWAKIAVYHSVWFYAIQGGIAISLLFAMLVRLPPRKRLSGFYVVHIALLVIIAGAVVTRYHGIDGTIELAPGSPTATVRLDEDLVHFSAGDTVKTVSLPRTVFPASMNQTLELSPGTRVTLLEYLPFASPSVSWKADSGAWFSEWKLSNDRIEQTFQIANRTTDEISDRTALGSLNIQLVEPDTIEALSSSLAKPASAKQISFVLIDRLNGATISFPELTKAHMGRLGDVPVTLSKIEAAKIGLTTYKLKTPEGELSFFPRFSSAPVTRHMQLDLTSRYRFFALDGFRNEATILIAREKTGDIIVAHGKGSDWVRSSYHEAIQLPWRNLKLQLLSSKIDQAPVPGFEQAKAMKEPARNSKALRVRFETKVDGSALKSAETWISDSGLLSETTNGLSGRIAKDTVSLPFTLELDRFKMDLVPGTQNPSSYESFIRVSSQTEPVHVFMNNPFKAAGFTFYQSSYFQDESGAYHSVLSVNKDPGRAIKYAGSFLLVIGLIIHFLILYGYLPFDRRTKT